MRILIVDGNNLVARGTFALPSAYAPDGRPVGGLYIALKMIRSFIATEKHDAVMIAMDNGRPAFRREVCPEYKAQRREARSPAEEKIHQDYVAQVAMCHELFRPFGMVTARAAGWEGDDVVAGLVSHRFAEHECTILSSDRDFIQLVDARVRLWDVGKDRWIESDPHFCLKRCLDPKASDNLDGVPGIGEKRADRLVDTWEDEQALLTENGPRAPEVETFIRWCTHRASVNTSGTDKIWKFAALVVEHQQKVRANWKCTNLRATASECNEQLKFRRCVPDRKACRDAISTLGLRPLAEEFSSLWPPFSELTCPV